VPLPRGATARPSRLRLRVASWASGFSRQVSEEEPPIPHTFVTYKVREVLKGEGRERPITLRFMGGPDAAGGYLAVQDVPRFEEGDEEALLLKGNGEVLCPLVRRGGGRYRIGRACADSKASESAAR